MDTSPAKIISFFNGEKQNVVPVFQRKYSWSRENWKTLWDDILEIYEERKDKQVATDDSSLFMGAVVTMPVRTVPVGVNKHLIIDGQQRLTTFALFLIAIRQLSDSRRQEQINDYLVNRHYDAPDKLKIIPTQDDREPFTRLVEQLSLADLSKNRMVEAVDFFVSSLQGKDSTDASIDIDLMFDVARTCLEVVSINLSDKDDPYLIFESLNYKGEPLSAADLVRNYILMRFKNEAGAGGEQEKIHRDIWLPLEQSLYDETTQKSYLTDYLSHYLSAQGQNAKRGKIYTYFKRYMDPFQGSEAAKDTLIKLALWGSCYELFIKPEKEQNASVRKHLESLIELKTSTPYPLLLKLFSLRSENRLELADIIYCLESIESFLVRRFILDIPTNSLARIFDKWAVELDEDNPVEWLTRSLLDGSGNRRWPGDNEVKLAIHSNQLYGKNICRFLLEAIEKSYGHKEVVNLQDSSVSIEHIMPQTLTEEWKEHVGEDWEDVHGSLLHTLGNLTLTAYNPELSNSPFEVKKNLLSESKIDLNKWISQQDSWGEEQIEQRASDLGEIVASIWRIPAIT